MSKFSYERERSLVILERKLNEMIANEEWSLTRNDLNDLIDEIAFSDTSIVDGDSK